MDPKKTTITTTFGECCENGIAMEKIGKIAEKGQGFNFDDLEKAKERFEEDGIECEIVDLRAGLEELELEEAYILIARNAVDIMFEQYFDMKNASTEIFEELIKLDVDKRKRNPYGKVVNSNARYNLCFVDYDQEPDYEKGKGRLVSFESIENLCCLRDLLPLYLGEKARELYAEGNYYYDVDSGKCGIGEHGDKERRKVVAVRFGRTMNICYRWYKNFQRVGDKIELELNHGDIYIMSEKAVGTDWRSSSIYTLRHCAGASKFTNADRS